MQYPTGSDASARIRVFVLDDHEAIRRGVAEILHADPQIDLVGEGATAAEGRRRIIATAPDVALLDIHLPDGNGIDVCRDVITAVPGIRCLMFTAYDEEPAMRASVVAGAAGFVSKSIHGDALVRAIRDVAAGRSLADPELHRAAVLQLSPPAVHGLAESVLGLREQQILRLIAEGHTNRQIGDRLGLAEKTIRNNVSSLLMKLGFERRTQAAVFEADRRLHNP